jgi:hypothetical protein
MAGSDFARMQGRKVESSFMSIGAVVRLPI